MTTHEKETSYLWVPGTNEIEVWYADRTSVATDSQSYRNVRGDHFVRHMWDVLGMAWVPGSGGNDWNSLRRQWYDSYLKVASVLAAITGRVEYFPSLESDKIYTVDSWKAEVNWHRYGERYLFSGQLEMKVIEIVEA